MKQKITFLSIILALLGGVSQTGFAQVVFTESFDATTFPPPGWTLATPAGTIYPFGSSTGPANGLPCPEDTSWVRVTTNTPICPAAFSYPTAPTHTGAAMAGFASSILINGNTFGPAISYLTTPAIDFSVPGAQYRIGFWIFNFEHFFNSGEAIDVYITTGPGGPFVTSLLNVQPNTQSGDNNWHYYTITVPATFNGTSNYVTFEASGAEGADLFLDDVSITQYLHCTGQPQASITGPGSVCGGVPFTLADTATSTAFALGITYEWQSKLTGSTNFTDFPGGNTASITTSIGLPTDFRLIEKCAYSGMVDTTPVHSVGINSFYNCYCGPATGNPIAGTSPNPLIDSVSITPGTLMNSTFTQLPAPNYYATYPPIGNKTTSLQQGGTYTLTSILGSFNGTAQGWIDFDQSGVFDPSEWINLTTPSASFTASGQFTVPQTGPTGLTGLRVRSGGSNGANTPCDSHDGETEDYVINIIPAPINDMGATLILQPLNNSTICANTNFTIKAVIKNLGTATQSNIVVKATYGNGSANNTIYTNDVDTIASFASDTVTIGTMSIPTEGIHTLKVYTTLANDGNTADDTAVSSIIVMALPATPVAISDTVCLGDTARIGVIGEAGNTYSWYNAPSGGTVLFTGMNTIIYSLLNTTIYYVSSATNGITSHLPVAPVTTGTEGCTGGITFDIQALTNLTVDSFETRFNATGLQQVNVYYRQGTAAGNETNPNAWVLVGSTVVNVASTTATYFVNVHVPLILTSGDTYGIYMNYNAAYSDAASGIPTYTDANMTVDFTNGLGLCSTFGNPTTTNMYFNGSVYYHTGGSDCESNRIPVVAAVGPKPVIDLGIDRTVCQSPTLILDAGNQGGTYIWNTGDTTQKIHVDTTGTYTVIVNKYCLATATVNLIVEPQPVATGINYTRAGNTYSFKVSGPQFVDGYYWKFGDGTTATDSTPVHTYPNGGPYNIVLVVYNGCGSDTIHWSVPTSVTTLNKNDNPIVLYPNPASSTLTVSGSDNMQIKDVIIINAVGAVVYKGDINKARSGNIDISRLASGHYILRANTSDGYYSQPFDVLRD